MTRKDYVKIADLIKGLSIGSLANTSCGMFIDSGKKGFHCETLIDCLCDMFRNDNSNFNKEKFIKACGFEAWKELFNGLPIPV